jgi:hypothetical protein
MKTLRHKKVDVVINDNSRLVIVGEHDKKFLAWWQGTVTLVVSQKNWTKKQFGATGKDSEGRKG